MKIKYWILLLLLSFILVANINLFASKAVMGQDGQGEIIISGHVRAFNEQEVPYTAADTKDVNIWAHISNKPPERGLVDANKSYAFQISDDGEYPIPLQFKMNGKLAKMTPLISSNITTTSDNYTATILSASGPYEIDLYFYDITREDIDAAKNQTMPPEPPITPSPEPPITPSPESPISPSPEPPIPPSLEPPPGPPEPRKSGIPDSELIPAPVIIGGGVIIGVGLLFSLFLLLYWKPRRKRREFEDHITAGYSRREPVSFSHERELKTENERLKSQLQTAKSREQDLMTALNQYQANQQKVPELVQKYSSLALQVKQLSDSLNEPLFGKLADNSILNEDYGALTEHINILQIVHDYLQDAVQKHQNLTEDCRNLVSAIKMSGIDTSFYEKYVNKADVSGLGVLKTVLSLISKSVEIRKASPEIMQEIEAYKERIERIRDYTYQVPPKSLLNFAEEMVKEACPAEEMTLREKTLKEILNIIDCYLKL